jgi:hypothetical protein
MDHADDPQDDEDDDDHADDPDATTAIVHDSSPERMKVWSQERLRR